MRAAGQEDWKRPLNANRTPWRRRIYPDPALPRFQSLVFASCQVEATARGYALNRCVGIGENIKVAVKGAENPPPGNSATCVGIYV